MFYSQNTRSEKDDATNRVGQAVQIECVSASTAINLIRPLRLGMEIDSTRDQPRHHQSHSQVMMYKIILFWLAPCYLSSQSKI